MTVSEALSQLTVKDLMQMAKSSTRDKYMTNVAMLTMVLVYSEKEKHSLLDFRSKIESDPDKFISFIKTIGQRKPTEWQMDLIGPICKQGWFDYEYLKTMNHAAALLCIFCKDMYNRGDLYWKE